jgi:hypothetical protein
VIKLHPEDHVPIYSVDLIAQLDKTYPAKCPDPSQTEREIWIYVGKRQLVESLLSKRTMLERYGEM